MITKDVYQKGNYKFRPLIDVDLRKNKKLSLKQLHKQLADGFEVALDKINQNLAEKKVIISLIPNDFKITMVDKILLNETEKYLFPSELYWITYIPKKIAVTISLDNPIIKTGLSGPLGPHIGYKITMAYTNKGERKWKICGHILINKEGNEKLPDRHSGETNRDGNYCYPVKLLFRSIKDLITRN